MKGFKNFLMRGDVITIAVGLVVATAFSTLIKSFTDFIINPIVARAQGAGPDTQGLGWQLGAKGNPATFLDLGQLISAIIYFIIFMTVVYFVIVLPYKHIQARRGVTVFGDPAPAQTCPSCLSDDLAIGATKCKYCTADIPADVSSTR
ncbi:MAG TPA: MscL family protein [Microlunatus sp.]